MGLQFLTVCDRSALDALRASWEDLNARAGSPSPLCSPAWFEGYLDHKLPSGADWIVLAATDDGDLVGVLPLVADARWRGGLRVPGEYVTHDEEPLVAAGLEAEIVPALLAAAFQARPRAGRIALGGVRAGTRLYLALEAQPRCVVRPEGEGARIPIEGDLESWRRGLGQNTRRALKKARRRLLRDHGEPLEVQQLCNTDADPRLFEEMVALEAQGWKGRDGGALATSPATLALYRDLVPAWAACCMLEWHRLRVAGRTVAMQMAVRLGARLTVLRICFDETFARYSPGALLLTATVEAAFEDGAIRELDLLQGQTWQARWHVDPVSYHRAYVYGRGLRANLFGLWRDRVHTVLRRNALLRLLTGHADSSTSAAGTDG